jgi:hypothetical protein
MVTRRGYDPQCFKCSDQDILSGKLSIEKTKKDAEEEGKLRRNLGKQPRKISTISQCLFFPFYFIMLRFLMI